MRAVAALQRGIQPEDDFVEFKAQWPVKSKARQLAGLCNKAAGEVVILIVGIDDKTGAVVNPGSGDVAAWWPGIRGQFDQTPPDLIRQQMVYVGDNEAVYAFAFNTERAPFVVKRGPDNPGFDVPFRDGTTTRSAHRHELISMLLPTVQVPPVSGPHRVSAPRLACRRRRLRYSPIAGVRSSGINLHLRVVPSIHRVYRTRSRDAATSRDASDGPDKWCDNPIRT